MKKMNHDESQPHTGSSDLESASRVIKTWPAWKQTALASVFGIDFANLQESAGHEAFGSTADDVPGARKNDAR
jgi:hypothetical protein